MIHQNEPVIPSIRKPKTPKKFQRNKHISSNLQIIVEAIEMEQEYKVSLKQMQEDVLNA